jgi:hypothetical protein
LAFGQRLTNAKGKVAKFILFKQAYKLGEDIVGVFNFTDASVPCVQVSCIFFLLNLAFGQRLDTSDKVC